MRDFETYKNKATDLIGKSDKNKDVALIYALLALACAIDEKKVLQ